MTASATVWVLISIDERMVVAVGASPEAAKAKAEEDAAQSLTWRERRNGRLVNDEWDYEIRPFEVSA